MKKKDPSCGMMVDVKGAEDKGLVASKDGSVFYFCSQKCKDKFLGDVKWYQSDKFGKIFPWFLGIVLVGGFVFSLIYDFMILYMGIFFILFSLMKMLDWKGFVNAFGMYDLVAKRVKLYGWIYPGLEFVLGLAFIYGFYVGGVGWVGINVVAWVTLVIMSIGGVGVAKNLMAKNPVKCACLGTKINVPLTEVTLLEDALMVVMAVMLIWF